MKEKQIILIRSVLFGVILLALIGFENASGVRMYKIGFYSVALLAMPYLRLYALRKNRVYFIIIDILLVFLISTLSRYVINYYVYALYMLLIIEAGLIYKLKEAKYIIILVIISTFYNYLVLYNYKKNWGTVSEIFFVFLINIVIVLGIILFKMQKEEKEKQSQLYERLTKTHADLIDANEQLKRLTSIEIKNNIARDIHDTFGHDMMSLIMEIEMAYILIEKDKEQAKEMLERAKTSARDGMKTVRTVVETLRNDDESVITETIDEMVDRFSNRVKINLNKNIDVSLYDYSKKVHDTLYNIVKECLTNSIRHSNAKKINIMILVDNRINFVISDDGDLEGTIIEGYGITGMRERVTSLDGELEISTDNGFVVSGYIEVSHD